MLKRTAPLLLIFFIALAFRSYRLTAVPPGLTHDEANHGREALGVLDGITPLFLTTTIANSCPNSLSPGR